MSQNPNSPNQVELSNEELLDKYLDGFWEDIRRIAMQPKPTTATLGLIDPVIQIRLNRQQIELLQHQIALLPEQQRIAKIQEDAAIKMTRATIAIAILASAQVIVAIIALFHHS